MLEIKGKYNTAIVYTDVVDSESVGQIMQLCSQEFTSGCRIRMMPDVHAGAGCTVGTTMTVKDRTVPNLVGVDIGCGMETVMLKEKHIELQKLDKLIYRAIPSGFAIRSEPHPYAAKAELNKLRCFSAVDARRGECSVGTLGGGNHFIEADRDDEGNIYLVIHSGSRHMGLEVARYYQERAYEQCNGTDKKSLDTVAAELRAQGREKDIQKTLRALKNTKRTPLPKQLCFASGELFEDYIFDMQIMQRYADLNRRAMMAELINGMGLHAAERFTTVHNYIDTDLMILRKGAVSALEGEKLLIPINMRDGSLVCIGLGNEEWNYSAPHGAGRLMSRSAAKERFTLTEFSAQMQGVYSTSVSRKTIDECPMAYKNMADIVENIGPTARIVNILRPIYNFKAGEEEA